MTRWLLLIMILIALVPFAILLWVIGVASFACDLAAKMLRKVGEQK